MGKYSKYDVRQAPPRKWKVHPIWRGIGCILLILLPVLSYVGAVSIVQENKTQHWFNVPKEMAGTVNSALAQKMPSMSDFLYSLPRVNTMDLLVTVALLIVGFGILTVIGSFFYSAMGPSRYTSLDSPPVGRSPHRRPR